MSPTIMTSWTLVCLSMVTVARAQAGIEQCHVNLVMAVDGSGSIAVDTPYGKPENWDEITIFCRGVVHSLIVDEDHALVGLVRFDSKGHGLVTIGNKTDIKMEEYLEHEFKYNPDGGNTNTQAGLEEAERLLNMAQREFNRVDVPEVVLVLTDGKPSPSPYNRRLPETIQRLKDRGVRIIGIGVTDQINTTQLAQMVSDPSTDYFTIDEFEELRDELNNIVNSVCEIFLTTAGPTRSTTPRRTTTTTMAPTPPPPTPCTPGVRGCRIDLVLVVDESGSIAADAPINNWEVHMVEFIINLIVALELGEDNTRIGMIMFQDNARPIFTLNRYYSKSEMATAVEEIECRCVEGGTTNIAHALRLARTQFFTRGAGDRPDVSNVVILLTDGVDNVETENLETEARLIKAVARVIAVGVTDMIDREELINVVVSDPDDFIEVENFSELASTLDQLISSTCGPDECECPPPVPIQHVITFSAYVFVASMRFTMRTTVVFEYTYTNIGDHYSTSTGMFTCPCKGVYFFTHSWSGVEHGLGSVIMKNNDMISPIAYVSSHGAASASTTIECNTGETVYVYIVAFEQDSEVITLHADMPLVGFSGHMIAALN